MILGCTELPIVQEWLEREFPQVRFVDPMEEVAERAVELYRAAEEQITDEMSYADTLVVVRQLYAQLISG